MTVTCSLTYSNVLGRFGTKRITTVNAFTRNFFFNPKNTIFGYGIDLRWNKAGLEFVRPGASQRSHTRFSGPFYS